jgi:hypothetical protein
VAAGLSPGEFWDITPREAGVILDGARDREWREIRTQQHLVYSMAVLMSYAVNAPAKMPKFDRAFPDRTPKPPQDPDEIYREMMAWVEAAQMKEEG